jgi:hypothetical protein
MKRTGFLLLAVVTVAGIVAHMAHASGQSEGDSSPIYGVKIPAGYRDWQLIAVKQLHFAGKGEQLRAQLGNDIAIKAFKEGTLPFPDGAAEIGTLQTVNSIHASSNAPGTTFTSGGYATYL